MVVSTDGIMSVVKERFDINKVKSVISFGSYMSERFFFDSDIDIYVITSSPELKSNYFYLGDTGIDCTEMSYEQIEHLFNKKGMKFRWLESFVNAQVLYDSEGGVAEQFVHSAKLRFTSECRVGREQYLMSRNSIYNHLRKLRRCKTYDYQFLNSLKEVTDGLYVMQIYHSDHNFYVHAPLRAESINKHFANINLLDEVVRSNCPAEGVVRVIECVNERLDALGEERFL